ncbi:MAG: transporter, family, multidrug resistance protein [Thermoproteota archaeon]|nr:transporter, family, multidrug resistance protein [Thermoproteota archaeon]
MERGFVCACIVLFLLGLSWSTINILLPLYATSIETLTTTLEAPVLFGTLWSVIGVARLSVETPSGILADRVGRRVTVVGGLGCATAAFIRYATAQTSIDVLMGGVLSGIGFAVTNIGVAVYAADYMPLKDRARYTGMLNGSMMASNIVGPILGSFIAQYFGLRASFFTSALIVSSAFVISILTIRDQKKVGDQTKGEKASLFQDYRVFLKNRVYLILFIVSFFFSLVIWSFNAMIFPNYGRNTLFLTIAEIGLLTSINSIALFLNQFFFSGIIARHLSKRNAITLGLLIYGAAAYSFSLLSDFVSLALAFIALGLSLGIINPSLEAFWIDITKTEERGRVFGLRITFFDLGQIFFSTMMPTLVRLNPRFPFYGVAMGALFNATILYITLRRTYKTTESNLK